MNRRRFIADGMALAGVAWTTSSLGLCEELALPPSAPSGRVVTLAAKPTPIDIDLSKTAVIVIDMQNDFCSKGGLLDRQGADISITQRAIAPTRVALSAARKGGVKVVYTKMGYQPDLSDVGPPGSPNWIDVHGAGIGSTVSAPNGTQSRILIRDMWTTDIIPELRPEPADTVLYKTRYSGFYRTELDQTLKGWGIRYLIFMGCTTSVCVESTIRDASFRDYSPVLLSDCTAEPEGYGLPRSNYEASLFLIEELFGWVSNSERFIHALAPPAAQG